MASLGATIEDERLPPFELGAFRVVGILGHGGMGQVWDAEHRATGHPAAIKTVSLSERASGMNSELFRREVLAMARLEHPCIAQIFEHGVVTASDEERSRHVLAAGSPWFAMQRANHGTLRSGVLGDTFDGLRRALLQVLDALAHAHARGIVHRDLKPHNVLADRSSRGVRLLLTDFGLARAVSVRGHSGGGTPGYMAPEQILEQPEREGPATDLYALGAVCWELTCGTTPFHGSNNAQILDAQLGGHCVDYRPRFCVPDELTRWIRRLLERNPEERFHSAAVAAHALRSMPDPTGPVSVTIPSSPHEDIRHTVRSVRRSPSASRIRRLTPRPRLGTAARPGISPHAPSVSDAHRAPPAGIGASLFGLRPPPLLGHAAALRSVWQALARVDSDGSPQLALIHGAPGVGARRLCEVVCEKANELGGLHSVRLRFSREGSVREVLGEVVSELFGVAPDDDRARVGGLVRARLRRHADADRLARVSAELARPSDQADGLGIRFESQRERERAFEDVLVAVSGGAPLVLWLDADGADDEAVAFALRTLERGSLPALLIATTEEPPRPSFVARAREHPRATLVGLAPLDAAHTRALLGLLFPLCPSTLETIAEWVDGNPFLAHQLLAHLVEAGALRSSDEGHLLGAPLPNDAADLYARRVERVAPCAASRRVLGLAAVFGAEVPRGLWRSACGGDADAVCASVEERMIATGLARATPQGWRFAAASIRSAALQRLEDPRAAHAACAAARESRGPAAAMAAAEAWERAGQPLRALTLYLEDLGHRVALRDHARAVEAGHAVERLLRELEIPLEDERWARSLVQRARAYLGSNHPERSEALLAVARRIDPFNPDVSFAGSRLASLMSRPDRAYELALAACRGHEARGDLGKELEAAVQLAYVSTSRGEVERGAAVLSRFSIELVPPHAQPSFCDVLAFIALTRGDFGEAHEHAERMMRLAEELGQPFAVALAWNNIGEARRCAWDVEGSREAYRESMRLFDEIGSPVRALPHYNELLLRVSSGELEPARSELESVLKQFEGSRFEEKVERSASYGLLVCATRARDAEATGHWLGRAYALGPDRGYHRRDLAVVAEVAGDEAARWSQPGTAARCYELAMAHYAPFDARAVARLEATMDRIMS